MICPPSADAADMDVRLDVPPVHDPAICRDRDIQPHGCTCAHGQSQPAQERPLNAETLRPVDVDRLWLTPEDPR